MKDNNSDQWEMGKQYPQLIDLTKTQDTQPGWIYQQYE